MNIELAITIDQILLFKKIYAKRYYIRVEDNRITFKLAHKDLIDFHEMVGSDYQHSCITPPTISIDDYDHLIKAIVENYTESNRFARVVKSGESTIHIYTKPFNMEKHYTFYDAK